MTEPVDPVQGRPAGDADAADRATLGRMAAGDQGAIEILYERYKGMAFALALRITGDAALAEDVLQEAFVGAWRNAGRFEPTRGSVKTWLLSIVHHRAIDATRRRRPASALPDPELPPPPALTAPDVWPEVAGRLDGEAIRAAMATLSDVQREALELAYFGGLTQQEIAVRTGAPLGTVKGRMRLALLALRRELTATDGPASGAGAP